MDQVRDLQRFIKKNRTTVDEMVYICQTFIDILTNENLLDTEHGAHAESIFSNDVSARTIESWVAKIAYDLCASRRSAEVRSYKIAEMLDKLIRSYAEQNEGQTAVRRLLGRPLTDTDIVRLLWVGDQGPKFTKNFFRHFLQHLTELNNSQLDLSLDGSAQYE